MRIIKMWQVRVSATSNSVAFFTDLNDAEDYAVKA